MHPYRPCWLVDGRGRACGGQVQATPVCGGGGTGQLPQLAVSGRLAAQAVAQAALPSHAVPQLVGFNTLQLQGVEAGGKTRRTLERTEAQSVPRFFFSTRECGEIELFFASEPQRYAATHRCVSSLWLGRQAASEQVPPKSSATGSPGLVSRQTTVERPALSPPRQCSRASPSLRNSPSPRARGLATASLSPLLAYTHPSTSPSRHK